MNSIQSGTAIMLNGSKKASLSFRIWCVEDQTHYSLRVSTLLRCTPSPSGAVKSLPFRAINAKTTSWSSLVWPKTVTFYRTALTTVPTECRVEIEMGKGKSRLFGYLIHQNWLGERFTFTTNLWPICWCTLRQFLWVNRQISPGDCCACKWKRQVAGNCGEVMTKQCSSRLWAWFGSIQVGDFAFKSFWDSLVWDRYTADNSSPMFGD